VPTTEPVRPKARPDLVFRELDEEWVLYDPTGKQLHVLNHSAAVVWLNCTGDATLAEITDAVLDAFEHRVPRAQVETDVSELVTDFANRGLLE
jgi:hypothetical protein